MVVTSLLTNEFAYRAKDEEGWRSVNRETQEDKYERKNHEGLGARSFRQQNLQLYDEGVHELCARP
jgi:hypothetical protein